MKTMKSDKIKDLIFDLFNSDNEDLLDNIAECIGSSVDTYYLLSNDKDDLLSKAAKMNAPIYKIDLRDEAYDCIYYFIGTEQDIINRIINANDSDEGIEE